MKDSEQSEELDLLKDHVVDIGDEVISEETVESDSGEEVTMLICHHGGTPYTILKESDHPFFRIRFRFNLIEQIAGRLSDGEIGEGAGESSDEDSDYQSLSDALEESEEQGETIEIPEESEGELIVAQEGDELPPAGKMAKDIIESMDDDVLDRFGLNLFQELSHPEVATRLIHTESDHFNGFTIDRKVFPSDSGFSLTEFNHSVQAVISLGTFGSNWFNQLLESELEDLDDVDIGQEEQQPE